MDNVLALLYVLTGFLGLLCIVYWIYAFYQQAVRDRFAAHPMMLDPREANRQAPMLDANGKIVGAPPTRIDRVRAFFMRWRQRVSSAYLAVVSRFKSVPQFFRAYWEEYRSYRDALDQSVPVVTDKVTVNIKIVDETVVEIWNVDEWKRYDPPSKLRQHTFPPREGVVQEISRARRRKESRETLPEFVSRQAD